MSDQSVEADEQPTGLDHRGGQIELVNQRHENQARTERVQRTESSGRRPPSTGLQHGVCHENQRYAHESKQVGNAHDLFLTA